LSWQLLCYISRLPSAGLAMTPKDSAQLRGIRGMAHKLLQNRDLRGLGVLCGKTPAIAATGRPLAGALGRRRSPPGRAGRRVCTFHALPPAPLSGRANRPRTYPARRAVRAQTCRFRNQRIGQLERPGRDRKSSENPPPAGKRDAFARDPGKTPAGRPRWARFGQADGQALPAERKVLPSPTPRLASSGRADGFSREEWDREGPRRAARRYPRVAVSPASPHAVAGGAFLSRTRGRREGPSWRERRCGRALPPGGSSDRTVAAQSGRVQPPPRGPPPSIPRE